VQCKLDHIVVVAPELSVGVEFIHGTLGVAPQSGGVHPAMGTHNCLLRLGDRAYLEVIAIDPAAPRPRRPRWFGLDALPPDARPRLAAWVARADDIEQVAAAAPQLGKITPMSRGSLNWRITVRDDGAPPLQGIGPSIIEWPAGVHPADRLPDSGCSLVRLEGHHPDPGKVSVLLGSIGFDGPFQVARPASPGETCLIAHIQTPTGPRRLSTAQA
jgi:hypothetical protein